MAEPESSREPVLTPAQRKLVGFTAGFAALVISITLIIALLIGTGMLIGHFSSVLWPVAVAGILALVMRPLVDLLQKKLKLRRLSSVIVLYAAFVLVLAGVLALLIPPLVEQVIAFIEFVPTFWQRAVAYVQTHYPSWATMVEQQLANPTIKRMVDGLLTEAQDLAGKAVPSLKAAGLGLLGVFGFFTHLAIVPIYLFFFLLSTSEPTRNLGRHLPFLAPDVRHDVVFLVKEFIAIVVSFFRGQLIIGLLMGTLLAIGFTIVGLKFGLIIGLALGILNIIPYLGTIIGLSVALPLAFLQPDGGGLATAAWVLAVFCIVQFVEGWFLTPKIMGDRTGLHPVAIIFAVFFWGTAFSGVLGMVLAIPLTAFFVTLWRLLKHKYLNVRHAA